VDDKQQPTNESQYIMDDAVSQGVAQIIRKRVQTFNDHRREILVEVQANLAYLVGEQNICLEGGHIQPIKNRRQINSVANIILPAVQKDVAVATMNSPFFDIVPAGTDDDDVATALVCHKLMQHIQRIAGRDIKRTETVLWYDIAGVGWRKVYWNPYKTVIGINPPPVNEDGSSNPGHNPQMEVGAAITQGEVEIDVIPTPQLIYDYREGDLRKLEWMIHAKRVTHQWVLDRLGPEITTKLSSKFSADSAENEFESTINSRFQSLSIGDETQQTATPKMKNSAAMLLDSDKFIDYYEYWQKPSKQAPQGMLAIMLSDQVVSHAPYPIKDYPHGELPFVPSAPLSLGSAIGAAISRISQARPLQREYNSIRSQIRENIDVMGNAVIFSPRTAKLRFKTLDNGAGNIIEYDGPVGKPTREPGVPMNGQVFSYLMEIRSAMDGIFAFNEPSRGVAPRNIDSAKGIQALQHADTVAMTPIVAAFELADEQVAYQALSLATANYKQGRMLNVVGSDFEWTLYEIDKNQLLGKFNVIIKPFSTMPSDKESEAMKAFSVWQSGLLGDPADPELRIWTMEQMQLGNAENILQRHSKQKNFAMKEFSVAKANLKDLQIPEGLSPEQLAKEIQARTFVPNINPFDDHMVHISAHGNFVMDNYWEFIATQNPIYLELLNNMQLHLQQHHTVLNLARQQQMILDLQNQMLIKGTTPGQLAIKHQDSGESSNKQDKKGK
jgi:hypothetical protein